MFGWVSGKWFGIVHGRNLVYNTCWEDPRLDRQALELNNDHELLMITSAGCNALDYLLDSPRHIYAVDVNPRQNALLELKVAGIRTLDYATFFDMFGRGSLPNHREVYQDALRPALPEQAREYWDRHIEFFSGKGWRTSFYFHGTSGFFARLINTYIDRVARVREDVLAMLEASSLDEQQAIYQESLREAIWTRPVRLAVGRDATLSLLGVPRAQRRQLERDYQGGIVTFIEDCLDAVFGGLPLMDNYFWRVYLTGRYTPECCPEYLRPQNFERLKAGLIDRVSTHTTTVLDFLESHDRPISRFVLLDHMDWLVANAYDVLQSQWSSILQNSDASARILFRSGGLSSEFVDMVEINRGGQACRVGDCLQYDRQLADRLHPLDRVHTYGSFHIANVLAA